MHTIQCEGELAILYLIEICSYQTNCNSSETSCYKRHHFKCERENRVIHHYVLVSIVVRMCIN